MGVSQIARPLTAFLTFPASRFAGMQRTYGLAVPPADVCSLIRGGVAVDPLFRPVDLADVAGMLMKGVPNEIVGRVRDDRFEIYFSGKAASSLGILGTVNATPTGSRVTTRVGWIGQDKWVRPAVMVLVPFAVIVFARELRAALAADAPETWAIIILGVLIGAGYVSNLLSTARHAREELPALFARLDSVLAPHVLAMK